MHVLYVGFEFRSDSVNEGGILEHQESSSVSPLQAREGQLEFTRSDSQASHVCVVFVCSTDVGGKQ